MAANKTNCSSAVIREQCIVSTRKSFNLQYVSKLHKKVVEHRLIDHQNLNNLHDINQSAYRSNHSTGTSADKHLCCSVLQGSVIYIYIYIYIYKSMPWHLVLPVNISRDCDIIVAVVQRLAALISTRRSQKRLPCIIWMDVTR